MFISAGASSRFAEDARISELLQASIAAALDGVDKDMVKIDSIILARRLFESRSLSDPNIIIEFTVITSGPAESLTAYGSLQQVLPETITSSIAAQLIRANISDYIVEATDLEVWTTTTSTKTSTETIAESSTTSTDVLETAQSPGDIVDGMAIVGQSKDGLSKNGLLAGTLVLLQLSHLL